MTTYPLLSIITFLPIVAALIMAVFLRGNDAAAASNARWLALVGVVGAGLVILTADAWGRRRSRFERGGAPVDAEATPLNTPADLEAFAKGL